MNGNKTDKDFNLDFYWKIHFRNIFLMLSAVLLQDKVKPYNCVSTALQ